MSDETSDTDGCYGRADNWTWKIMVTGWLKCPVRSVRNKLSWFDIWYSNFALYFWFCKYSIYMSKYFIRKRESYIITSTHRFSSACLRRSLWTTQSTTLQEAPPWSLSSLREPILSGIRNSSAVVALLSLCSDTYNRSFIYWHDHLALSLDYSSSGGNCKVSETKQTGQRACCI